MPGFYDTCVYGSISYKHCSVNVTLLVFAEDYEWKPPTEAEMKVLNARRERSDKISKLMGEYMLKGYKMMGHVCAECSVSIGCTEASVRHRHLCKHRPVYNA